MFNYLLDFLFPKRCVGCGVYGKDLCCKCFRELPIAEQICPECGRESPMGWTHVGCKKQLGMDGLIVIYDYQDKTLKAAIDGVKFDFNKDLIGGLLKNFRFETGTDFDYLVPVPLHFYRQNWRGFNQAEEIAKIVSRRTKVKITNVLERKRNTKQQSSILDRSLREKNIKGAFEVREEYKGKIKGKKILLIDDVFTSGADMRECTKMLKNAGAEVVWGLAMAH
jgi:competence protein ComFC